MPNPVRRLADRFRRRFFPKPSVVEKNVEEGPVLDQAAMQRTLGGMPALRRSDRRKKLSSRGRARRKRARKASRASRRRNRT